MKAPINTSVLESSCLDLRCQLMRGSTYHLCACMDKCERGAAAVGQENQRERKKERTERRPRFAF